MPITTLLDFLNWAEKSFLEANLHFGHGTDNAWDEAVSLARFVLQFSVDADYSIIEQRLKPEELQRLYQLVEKRIIERIPVPYLTHEAWFAGLKFYVDENVLIPRSPIAEWIEQGFEPWVESTGVHRILDLCTGSGCIAIALAYAFPDALIDAVDISSEALQVAQKNITLHHCENRVKLLHADLFSASLGQRYDMIISNPPYVDHLDIEQLPLEYRYEPNIALAAGTDGLVVVRRILKDAPQFLTQNGLLIVEVGNSEEALVAAYPNLAFTWLEFSRGGSGVFLLQAKDLLS